MLMSGFGLLKKWSTAALMVVATFVIGGSRRAAAQDAVTSGTAAATGAGSSYASIYDIPVEPMKEESTAPTTGTTLAPYRGKVLLIVNVASKCGFTKQYTGLEALHRRFKDRGLAVVGFPSNDFKGQEPGSEAEIVQFCRAKYDVTFPLYAKIPVTGAAKAPLYQFLTNGRGEVGWNFNKFLVARDGRVLTHFESKVAPDSPELIAAIEKALGEKADSPAAP